MGLGSDSDAEGRQQGAADSGPLVISGDRLHLVAVLPPPDGVPGSHVVVALTMPDVAIDQLAHDVRMTRVPMGLSGHMNQNATEGDRVAGYVPPRHVADAVKRQQAERCVGMGPHPLVEGHDLTA